MQLQFRLVAEKRVEMRQISSAAACQRMGQRLEQAGIRARWTRDLYEQFCRDYGRKTYIDLLEDGRNSWFLTTIYGTRTPAVDHQELAEAVFSVASDLVGILGLKEGMAKLGDKRKIQMLGQAFQAALAWVTPNEDENLSTYAKNLPGNAIEAIANVLIGATLPKKIGPIVQDAWEHPQQPLLLGKVFLAWLQGQNVGESSIYSFLAEHQEPPASGTSLEETAIRRQVYSFVYAGDDCTAYALRAGGAVNVLRELVLLDGPGSAPLALTTLRAIYRIIKGVNNTDVAAFATSDKGEAAAQEMANLLMAVTLPSTERTAA